MFQMKDEMQTAVKHNIRGGEGSPSFRYLFSAEQLGGRAEMMAVITLQPGESVGAAAAAVRSAISSTRRSRTKTASSPTSSRTPTT